jgi:hypothetical protein
MVGSQQEEGYPQLVHQKEASQVLLELFRIHNEIFSAWDRVYRQLQRWARLIPHSEFLIQTLGFVEMHSEHRELCLRKAQKSVLLRFMLEQLMTQWKPMLRRVHPGTNACAFAKCISSLPFRNIMIIYSFSFIPGMGSLFQECLEALNMEGPLALAGKVAWV